MPKHPALAHLSREELIKLARGDEERQARCPHTHTEFQNSTREGWLSAKCVECGAIRQFMVEQHRGNA